MAFKVIKDLEDYKQFMLDVYSSFSYQEEWEDTFGISLKWNEETGEVLETLDEYKGEIKVCPEEFPSILYYNFEIVEDYRAGNLTIRQLDWINLEDVKSYLRIK